MSYNSQNSENQLNKEVRFFKEVLLESGVILSFSEEPHTLIKEQSLVIRDINKYFEQSIDLNKLEEFIKGLQKVCQKEKWFRQNLLSTRLRRSNENGDLIDSQECLFRVLLNVTTIQDKVLDILLDEITSTVEREDSQDTTWLQMLLRPLRSLPFIKDSHKLTSKLLDILEVAKFACQLEILDSIHDILPDSEYQEVAKQLCNLLNQNDDLSGAVVDCLNFLNLEPDVRAQVQDKILAKMLAGNSLKMFPIFLQFLLTNYKQETLVQVLYKVRNALDNIMISHEKNKERESCKIVIFNSLQNFTITQKSLVDGWLNTISTIKVHSDHKPVDLLILIMLHHVLELKRRVIEAIFRKRISAGLFRVCLLEKMFQKYLPPQLLRDYFTSLVEIGSSLLLSSSEILVIEFASTLFQSLFNHPHSEVLYRSELLRNLIILTATSDSKNTNSILKTFKALLKNTSRLREHTALLMQLLEIVNRLELKAIKEVFEILCALTCGEGADDSVSGLKNEISILIRKQLASGARDIEHRGIIGAVVMIKHMVSTSEEQSENVFSEESICIENLRPEGPKEAAGIFSLTSKCTDKCSELKGLFYDQLSFMLRDSQNLDKMFMNWLNDKITEDFLNKFLVQEVPGIVNELEFSVQYLLNSADEMDNPYWVDIGHLTVASSNLIILLAPHFCLLRLLNYKNNAGDLSSIDALLGCGIIMPKFEDIHDLETHHLKHITDCLFHCVNWFREIISGFVKQKSKQLKAKVVRRLQDLIDVEKLLNSCIDLVPDHNLPISYFHSLANYYKQTSPNKLERNKNPKKKFKSAAVVEEANESMATAVTSTQKSQKSSKSNSKKSVTSRERKVIFRDMDTDILELFKYPLKLDDLMDDDDCSQSIVLNIEQVKFLLKDFVTKLSILTQGSNTGLSHINIVAPASIITDCVTVLPNINRSFKCIVRKIILLLEKTDSRHDLPDMFTEEILDIKTCFGLVLDVFYYVFSWSGFQHSSNLDLLKHILKSMRPENSQTLNSANRLIIEFINRMSCYTDYCLHLNHATSLIRTMEALQILATSSPETQKKIASTSGKLLSKRWYNISGGVDCGKICNENIDILVKSYLSVASTKTLCGLVGTLQDQAESLKTKEDCLHMLSSIDKQNFHVFYAGLCNALLERVKTEIMSLTNNEHLTLWQTTALTMQGLMTVAKAQQSRLVLASFLKKCISILKVFCSQGVPILEIMLKHKPDEVVKIFKTIQTTTRFLHHLCCTSKLNKDTSLVAHVPHFRLTLESLVFRVKAALVANSCSAAFWMGNLKNKDIQGEEILTQSTISLNDDESEEQNDLLPSDNDDDDIPNDNESLAGSEIFE